MSQKELRFELSFALPPERVWSALADHASMGKWTGADVKLVARGDERGVGAIRRVRVGPFAVDEEIVYVDPPRRMVYRVLRGAPVSHHRGEILLEPEGAGSRLTWNIRFVAAPGVARALDWVIHVAIGRGLRELRGLIGG
jgi:uncharacterized protein YndB with AHSA1/START domain